MTDDPHLDQVHYHERVDPHFRSWALSDVILGGQDGLVNTLGVILGVAAAAQETRLVVAAGLAATFAEAVSMAAVAYTVARADHARYESERAREFRHVHRAPDIEREELRDIYARKGFTGEALDHIVETIAANPDVWVSVMLAEEHNLTPIEQGSALKSASIVGFASLIGALIPLTPFFFVPIAPALWASLGCSVVALFGVGWYKGRRTRVGHPFKNGAELAIIGTVSALVGYGIGWLFQSPAGG